MESALSVQKGATQPISVPVKYDYAQHLDVESEGSVSLEYASLTAQYYWCVAIRQTYVLADVRGKR